MYGGGGVREHPHPFEVCPPQSAPSASSLLTHFSATYRQRQPEWEKEGQDWLLCSIWQAWRSEEGKGLQTFLSQQESVDAPTSKMILARKLDQRSLRWRQPQWLLFTHGVKPLDPAGAGPLPPTHHDTCWPSGPAELWAYTLWGPNWG